MCDLPNWTLKLTDDMYVFTGHRQTVPTVPYSPHGVSSRYKDMANRLGIDTHIHALRHYSATELLSAGIDLRTVAGRLGHGGEERPPYVSTPPGSPPPTVRLRRFSAPACRSVHRRRKPRSRLGEPVTDLALSPSHHDPTRHTTVTGSLGL